MREKAEKEELQVAPSLSCQPYKRPPTQHAPPLRAAETCSITGHPSSSSPAEPPATAQLVMIRSHGYSALQSAATGCTA